jgi:hypothetical protein
VIEKFSMETCRVSKSDQRLLVIVSCLVGGSLTFLAFYLRILAKLRGGDDDELRDDLHSSQG